MNYTHFTANFEFGHNAAEAADKIAPLLLGLEPGLIFAASRGERLGDLIEVAYKLAAPRSGGPNRGRWGVECSRPQEGASSWRIHVYNDVGEGISVWAQAYTGQVEVKILDRNSEEEDRLLREVEAVFAASRGCEFSSEYLAAE